MSGSDKRERPNSSPHSTDRDRLLDHFIRERAASEKLAALKTSIEQMKAARQLNYEALNNDKTRSEIKEMLKKTENESFYAVCMRAQTLEAAKEFLENFFRLKKAEEAFVGLEDLVKQKDRALAEMDESLKVITDLIVKLNVEIDRLIKFKM